MPTKRNGSARPTRSHVPYRKNRESLLGRTPSSARWATHRGFRLPGEVLRAQLSATSLFPWFDGL